jgi:ABC-type multidrug transport system fused ATPase/permease subunit
MHLMAAFASGASARLFDRALWAVLRSPMRFFDTTPLGRVLSRLSFDVDVLDSKMLPPVSGSLASSAWLLSAVVVMLGVVPWSAAALLPALGAYATFNAWVRPTLRELQQVYELLLERPLHKASFRRSLHAAHLVEPTKAWRAEGRGRPAQLYKFAPRRRRGAVRGVRFELAR